MKQKYNRHIELERALEPFNRYKKIIGLMLPRSTSWKSFLKLCDCCTFDVRNPLIKKLRLDILLSKDFLS